MGIGYNHDAGFCEAENALKELAQSVLDWAKTPGNHGGNPYTKDFVILAERALEHLDQEDVELVQVTDQLDAQGVDYDVIYGDKEETTS